MDEQVLVQSVEDNDTVSEEAQVAGGSGGGSDDRAAAEAERLEISRVQRFWAEQGDLLLDTARECILAAWRPGTWDRYGGVLSSYWNWLRRGGIWPITDPVASSANYLGYLFDKGLQYKTINVHHSGIAARLPLFQGISLGRNVQICKLMKGIRNRRQTVKKLVPVWSVEEVLMFFVMEWGELSILPLEQLTIKVVMLVSLVTAKRPRSLKLMTVAKDFFRQKEDSMEFVLVGWRNTQEPVVLTICEVSQLDPVTHVNEYVRRMAKIWKSDQLIVSERKPYEAANTKQIVKCLKEAIVASGQFGTGGSVRSKSATRARLRGASQVDVMKVGDWTRVSTFMEYYFKPTSAFANAVLE